MIASEAFGHGINDVANDSGATHTMNGSLTVEWSDHGLYLKALMGSFPGRGERDAKYSLDQAAEHLWDSFVGPLQR